MLKRLKQILAPGQKVSGETDIEGGVVYLPREKFLVFAISFILAFCLWFIVNLNRDFNITVEVPLEVRNVPEEMALVNDPPERVLVDVSGEGWILISLYHNPPGIQVDVNEGEVNLFDFVQQQVSAITEVSVLQVRPQMLNLQLEEKIDRVVPVEASVELKTRNRFGIIGEPRLVPDKVTVSGAASKVREVEKVGTVSVDLEDVSESGQIELEMEKPASGVTVSPRTVTYVFDITEFTEGETRVPLRVRNLPPGRALTYNPSTITVRYDVPIDQYHEVQNARLFTAYIDYSTLEEDTTGVVVPQIERSNDDFQIRLRSFQPRTVSYFNVIQSN